MALNNLNITAADSGKEYAMRGDMGAFLNFVPNDNFSVSFFTQDNGNFTLFSDSGTFRQLDGTTAATLTFGGSATKFVTLMFNGTADVWEMVAHNLNGGTGGGGTVGPAGPAGTAATLSLGSYESVPLGQPLEITQGGSPSARTFSFKIPSTNPDSGTGGVFTPETLLTQNAAGEITPNKAAGNNFRVILTKNGKMLNPIGYSVGEVIRVAARQGPLGPFTLDWDLQWAHPDRQVPVLAKQPGGLNRIESYLTGSIDANNPGGWTTDVLPKASTIGYGVPSFIAKNITTGVSDYVLRSPTGSGAMTAMRPNQTLKILRNGLGIEAYGAIDGSNASPQAGTGYLISGALQNGNRAELRTGEGVRAAYDRGVLIFAGPVTAIVQDLILSGAREQGGGSHIAQGIGLNSGANVTTKNVLITDNENGILTGADYTGTLNLIDTVFDANAKGDFGYTHNIYTGEHLQPWYALRTTFKNAPGGHNIKSRSGDCILNQVHTYDAKDGREVDLPNGGQIHATDCRFEHLGSAAQNDCIRIGAEGVITTRPREYILRNCHIMQGKPSANAASFIWNQDTVPVRCIDCTFEGVKGWPGTDANGMIGLVNLEFTGGPVGPRVPVGYQAIPVTPIAG